MTEHFGPWTEADYLGVDSGINRIELLCGNLLVSPWPDAAHQTALTALSVAVTPAANDAGLEAWRNVQVRLNADTIVIPDLVVADRRPAAGVVDVSETVLLCEVVSVTSAAIDLLLKRHLYATSHVDWYLTAELDPVVLRLHRLQDGRYFEHAVARQGQILTSSFPFPFAVATTKLFD